MKMPNQAVKMGSIFAVGLVAISLSFGLLFSGAVQADGDHHEHTEDVVDPHPGTATDPAVIAAILQMKSEPMVQASPVVTVSISGTENDCVGWEGNAYGEMTAEVTEPAGSGAVKADNEFHEAAGLCWEISWFGEVWAQVKVWATKPSQD